MDQSSRISATLIVEKGKPGRPKIHRILPYQHYEGNKDGKRQRCQSKGCRKWLKKHDSIVCSSSCANIMKKALLDQIKLIEKDSLKYGQTH